MRQQYYGIRGPKGFWNGTGWGASRYALWEVGNAEAAAKAHALGGGAVHVIWKFRTGAWL
tara:strand:+ start:997 stop:1176 length:180 start_codon:yes stop_codon:yes gene_type:complete